MTPTARRFLAALLPILLVDRFTKTAAAANLPFGVPRDVLGEVVRFTLMFNRGAALDLTLGPWSRWGFSVIAVVGIIVMLRLLRTTEPGDRWRPVALGLVCAGAAGNLVDRLLSTHGVVDFIDVGLGSHRFWIFNVADIGVVTGALLLAYSLSRERNGPRTASHTAWGVLVLRAAHHLVDDPPPILNDPVALRLLDADAARRIREAPDHLRQPHLRAIRGHVVTRSRYAEERLAEAVQRGVKQCVVLGAGYDTFAYRQPAWAGALQIFEVDHPASQKAKQERLTRAGVAVPANVVFAAIDFEHETLMDGLQRAGFDASRPTFVSCLGVLVYLTEEAVEGVFRLAASLPSGSEIVCTFKAKSPERDSRVGPVEAAATAAGEPWLSRFDPDELARRLYELGFVAVTMISGPELEQRYAADRTDGVRPPRTMMMLSATT